MSYFALIVYIFSRAWKCDKLQPRPGQGGPRCNDNLVRQGSSLRNWERWGRPLQRGCMVWRVPHSSVVSGACMASSQALLVTAFPRRIRDERPLGPCHLKRIGCPENEGLGNFNVWRQWRSNYKARGGVEKGSKFMIKPIFKYTGPWTRRHEYMKLSRSGVMGFWLFIKNMKYFKVPEMVRIDLDFRLGPETGKEIKQPYKFMRI